MTLEDWRLLEVLTYTQLAERLSEEDQTVAPETVRRWCLPESDELSRMPDRFWLRRIHALTGGKVTADDFAGISRA